MVNKSEIVRLGDKATVLRGGSPRPISAFITNSPDGINWIKIGDVSVSDKYIRKTAEKIIPEGVTMSRRVFPGDLILSNSMSFGRPYILKIDGCIHDGWLVIQNYQDTFEPEYLLYALGSQSVMEQYIAMAAGSSVQNLNKEKVSDVRIWAPPISEQRKIANALSDIDNQIDAIEHLIEKKISIKQGVMQEILSGKRRIPGFTKEWREVPFSFFAVDMADGPFGSNLKVEHYTTNQEVRIVQLSNIGDDGWKDDNVKYTTFSHAREISRSVVHPGNVIIAKMMPAGRAIICPNNEKGYVLSSDAVKVVVDESKAIPMYIVYATKSKHFLQQIADQIQGSTRARTSITKLKNNTVMLPELDEQKAIVDMLSSMDAEVERLSESLEKYRKVKSGMLSKLLSGEIRI